MIEQPADTDSAALRAEVARLTGQLAAAEHTIQQLAEKLDAALEGTGLCLWQGMPQTGALTVFNLQAFKPGEMAPHFDQWVAKLHPEDREAVLANYFAHLAGDAPCYDVEYRTLGADGNVTWLWDHGRVVEWDDAGQPVRVMGAHADITRRKQAEQELARLANHDPLTGLPNRTCFFRQLEQRIAHDHAHTQQMAVLFLDLDDFKLVNDQFGHVVGDQALQAVARQLQTILRDNDLVARLGGDEFIVLLQGTGVPGKVQEIADRILQTLGQPLTIGQAQVRIGASIGVSLFPEHGTSAEALVLHADSAMYLAKSRGRHRVAHYQPLPTSSRHDAG